MGYPARTPEEFARHFWLKVDRTADCWVWTAATSNRGYGKVGWGGRTLGAPRVAYEMEHGAIPHGLMVCHTCDNPPCVNPAHLFLGTHQDNMRDKVNKGRGCNGRTGTSQCPRGHLFSVANTYHRPGGRRTCRTCYNEARRSRRATLRAAGVRDWYK